MNILISGGTGLVGRFITDHFLAKGDTVIVTGRKAPAENPFSRAVTFAEAPLDPDFDFSPLFAGVDILVHAAFHHQPGRYRGGEGDDPQAFRRANVDGSLAMFRAAKAASVSRAVFLASRAVYDGIAPATVLTEGMPVAPTSLYGQVKREVEQALAAMADTSFHPVSLRATGIYGPGPDHKWKDLFADFAAGKTIAPRVATEVHGDDLAAAVALVATAPADQLHPVYNVSDIVLDRRDLLTAFSAESGTPGNLPRYADAMSLNVMDCSRLKALGWSPRGMLDLSGM